MADSAKERLVDFLEEKAFRPVLKADPESYPQGKRNELRDVQEATRAEVYEMYKDDLSSEPGQGIHRQLKDLDLPTLGEVRDEFERLARDAGIRG